MNRCMSWLLCLLCIIAALVVESETKCAAFILVGLVFGTLAVFYTEDVE